MRVVSLGLVLACAAIMARPAMADTILWKSVGGWDVSFYPGTQGCQAFAVFEEDTAFFIGFDGTGDRLSLDVTLLDQRWSSLKPGEDYNISVRFGAASPWTMAMRGLMIDGFPGLHILIDADTDQAALFAEEFRRMTRMEWSYEGNLLGRFTLRGSNRAFQEVMSCQRSYQAARTVRTDPFAE